MSTTDCPRPARITVRGAYSDHLVYGDRPDRRLTSEVSGPTRVRQEFKAESDINNVILRYTDTGFLPPRLNAREPSFMDVSEVPEFHEAMNKAREARELFLALPDAVRQLVGDDPRRLLEAVDQLERYRASNPEVEHLPSQGAGGKAPSSPEPESSSTPPSKA